MEYLQSIRAQAVIFCATVGFGFLLGLGYDLARLARLMLRSRRTVLWDVGFAVPSGIAAFLFLLTQNGGKVRLHLLAALGVGFCIWYFCAAVPARFAANGILRAERRALAFSRNVRDRVSASLGFMRRTCAAAVRKQKDKAVKKLQKKRKSS